MADRKQDIVERMAEAMWEENRTRCKRVEIDLPEWGSDRVQLREDWRAFARAALMAIREPSEDIAQHIWETVYRGGTYQAGFTAAIDAILADSPPCPSAPGSVEREP